MRRHRAATGASPAIRRRSLGPRTELAMQMTAPMLEQENGVVAVEGNGTP